MSSHVYKLVPSYSPSTHEEDGEKDLLRPTVWHSLTVQWNWVSATVIVVLIASLSMNALLLYQQFSRPWELYNTLPTQHAGLRRDVPRDLVPPQEFASLNRTIQDAAWNDERLSTWDLFVALEEDYVVSQGLSHAQRWPWDSNKGVYIPVAAHELHCVQVIRSYVNDMSDGVAEEDLTWNYEHSIHCLNILRESVMCNADEQLMYTGRLHANLYYEEAEPGRGVMKQCRSWDALKEWAHAHSACYQSVHREDPHFPEVERYKFCPDDSRPWEKSS